MLSCVCFCSPIAPLGGASAEKQQLGGASRATQSGAEGRFRGFLGGAATAGCAVIAAALGASATGPAFAQQVALANPTYVYTVNFPLYDKYSSSPLEQVSNPVPFLGTGLFFSTNGGTPGGSYSLEAGTGVDRVDASLNVAAAPNSDAFLSVILLAETQFQVEVVQKSGANPPKSITSVPVIVQATGSAICAGGDSSASASVDLGLLAPLIPLTANCSSNGPDMPAARQRVCLGSASRIPSRRRLTSTLM